MSSVFKLWKPYPLEDFASLVATDYAKLVPNYYEAIHKRSMLAEWLTTDLEWHRNRKTDKLSENLTFMYSELCVRSTKLRELFPVPATDLEFLPMRVGPEEWLVVNCLRDSSAIDLATSDLRIQSWPDLPDFQGMAPTIMEIRWINLVEPRGLADQWEIVGVPTSILVESSRRQLVTDVFIARMQTLGPCGVGFKHVGYIVPDASQAVPKPPEQPKPQPTASKRKQPKLSARAIPASDQIEIAEAGAQWRERLQLAPEAAPKAILQRMTEAAHELQPTWWTIAAEKRIDALLGLSSIYGELLRKHCGWSWVELSQSRNKRWIAVAAADNRHALALLPYVQQQIESQSPTFTLLFNMVAAGNLPLAEPGALTLIA